jgi:predicted extracellular nuclease
MKTPDGVGDIANQAKAMALADVVKYRETTNQQALRFYEKMYEDLKPKDYTTEKLNSLNSAIANVSAAPDINDAIDTVRQIFRENFAVAPKSNIMV